MTVGGTDRVRAAFPILLLLAATAACSDRFAPASPARLATDAVASASPGYEIVDLGTLGGQVSQATSLNDSDAVAGWSQTTDEYRPPSHAFLWTHGSMQDLGTLGGCCSRADAVNLAGQVAGSSTTASGEWHAFLWTAGQMLDLGNLGDQMATAGLNARGEVVGQAIINPSSPSYRAWLWDGSQLVDLGPLSSFTFAGYGVAVNNRGQVLLHDALWDRGTSTGLGLGGARLNQGGIVVGVVDIARDVEHAAVWRDGQVTDLGAPNTPSDPASSSPTATNAAAAGAGRFGRGQFEGVRHAALWRRVQ